MHAEDMQIMQEVSAKCGELITNFGKLFFEEEKKTGDYTEYKLKYVEPTAAEALDYKKCDFLPTEFKRIC